MSKLQARWTILLYAMPSPFLRRACPSEDAQILRSGPIFFDAVLRYHRFNKKMTNLVPPEVHLSVWNRGNDNGEPRKVTGLPAKAPPEEATIYRFESAHKSGNDMVDALNRELIDLFNQTGNGRREVLSLLDQPKSSEVSKGIERWGRALDALRLKVGLKREQIVAAGGTPIAIPGHFKKFPKLLKA